MKRPGPLPPRTAPLRPTPMPWKMCRTCHRIGTSNLWPIDRCPKHPVEGVGVCGQCGEKRPLVTCHRYDFRAVRQSVRSMKRTWAYRLGIHSNIPECCVRFYIENQDRITAINIRRGLVADGVEYVMCTRCLRAFRAGHLSPSTLHICRDSRDGPLCHRYLSGPDRSAGLAIRRRYTFAESPS